MNECLGVERGRDAVLVSSGGSQLKIVFENESQKEGFVLEFIGLFQH